MELEKPRCHSTGALRKNEVFYVIQYTILPYYNTVYVYSTIHTLVRMDSVRVECMFVD